MHRTRQHGCSFALAAPSTDAAGGSGLRYPGTLPTGFRSDREAYAGRDSLHVRMPGGERPLRRLQRVVFDLRRLAIETSAKRARQPEESLENLTRLAGEEWAARGP